MNIKEITDYIFIGNEPCKADAIFVVGGSLPDAARLAADANADGKISALDYVRVKKVILKSK